MGKKKDLQAEYEDMHPGTFPPLDEFEAALSDVMKKAKETESKKRDIKFFVGFVAVAVLVMALVAAFFILGGAS